MSSAVREALAELLGASDIGGHGLRGLVEGVQALEAGKRCAAGAVLHHVGRLRGLTPPAQRAADRLAAEVRRMVPSVEGRA